MNNENKTMPELLGELQELRRKLAELEQKDGEQKLALLSEQGLLSVAIVQDDEVKFANQAMADILELPLPQLIGLKLDQAAAMIHPDDRAFILDQIKKKAAGEKDVVIRYSYRILTPSGKIKWLDNHSRTITYEGRPADFVTSVDITELKQAELALQREKERARKYLDLAAVIMVATDREGRVAMINRKGCEVLGREEKDLLGKNWFETCLPPEAREEVPRLFAAMMQGEIGLLETYENPVLTAAGGQRIISWHNAFLTDESGAVIGTISSGEDITERKLAQEARRESENRLRAAIESLPFDFFIIGPDGRYVMQNSVCAEHWGDVTGKRPDDVNATEAAKAIWRENNRRAFSGEVVTGEVEFEARTGKLHLFNIIAPILHQGRVREILGVNIDITGRKAAEDELAAEKERLSVTLRSIGDGVVTTDVNGAVVLMNQVAEKLTGWTQREAQGRPLSEIFCLIDERTRERREDPVKRIIVSGAVLELEGQSVLRARDGSERLIADSGAPIKDRDSRIIGTVLVFRDVTEKRRMEEELAKADKLESVGILAGGIAHDFNNILTSVLGNVSFARRLLPDDDKASGLLIEAEKTCVRARDLTQQLLTFSKGGAPIRTPSSIADFIRETATFALGGSATDCRFEFDPDLAPVEVDQGQISQVINNLVINADQSMPGGGRITIRAENHLVEGGGAECPPLKPGPYIKITIADQGLGIPEEHLPKIFDPFFTTKHKGSGLGLAITYSIIKKHDGGITAESRPGKGAAFHVYLPASTRKPRKKAPPRERSLAGKGRVLLMDDEESIRVLVGKALREIGYEVELAREGSEVLVKYSDAIKQRRPFDAVILDLTVRGGMGGKETIVKLLELDPQARAIVTSGYSTDDVMANYKKFGFKGMLAKPFKLEQLNQAIHALIAGGRE
ncbi:MAG TPA: PAS domain S-box protein [bacterium]|nr:PAS domain S-box protein [bacterium]